MTEAPLALVIVDRNGLLHCGSGNAGEYFPEGGAVDGIVGQAPAGLRRVLRKALDEAASTGGAVWSEPCSTSIQGREQNIRIHVQALQGRSGDDLFFQIALFDAGSRAVFSVPPESAAVESHLLRVIGNLPGFVCVLDPDGVLLEASRSALVAGGLSPDDVIGKKFHDGYWWNYSPESVRQLQDAIERALAGETVRYDTMVRMEGDSRIPVDFMLVPARDDSGRITHIISSGLDIRDRKRAEQSLLDSVRHLNFALDTGRLGAWKLNLKTEQVEWSEQMYEICGVRKEKFDGTLPAVLAMIHPDDRGLQLGELADVSRSHSGRFETEYRVIRPVDGQTVWIHSRAAVMGELADRTMALNGVVIDVTDRKRRELATAFAAELQLTLAGLLSAGEIMRVAGQKTAEYLGLSHCLFLEMNGESGLARVLYDHAADGSAGLRGGFRMAGFVAPDEMELLAAGQTVTIDDTSCGTRRPEAAARFASLGVGSVLAAACLHSQQRLEFLLAALKPEPCHWRDDEIGLMESLARQLHQRIERAKAETALAESERSLRENGQRLSMALRAGGMAAWEWRPESIHWTDELYELIGIPKDRTPDAELFLRHVHPEDLPELEKTWRRAAAGLDSIEHEFRIVRPDGETRWTVGVGQLVRDDHGNISRIFGMNWDSTREHLASEALRESERRAQEANVAKSEFLANMSHEIRTPMTSILGYADLLLASETDPEKAGQLRTIKRNGSFLLEIINDILDLSGIEAGKLRVEQEQFAPHRIVRDVLSLMQVRADEKGIGIEVEFDGPLPARIQSDSRRLKQILVNLVGNAIKFTETGSVRLVARLLPAENPRMQFDVIDTGIGMSRVQQEQLFQPFVQGDTSVSRAYEGTGLGLAISRRLAILLGGDISVKSEPEKGSTFSCTIQAGDIRGEEMIQPDLGAMTDSWKEDPSLPRLSCRVLVVDDRRDVRVLTRLILSKAGATVETADDGQEALDFVMNSAADARPPVDVILLDMQMPRLDGYQTAAALRRMGFRNPIIALTADAMQGDMTRCLACGCDACLSKPINSRELVVAVDHHVAKT